MLIFALQTHAASQSVEAQGKSKPPLTTFRGFFGSGIIEAGQVLTHYQILERFHSVPEAFAMYRSGKSLYRAGMSAYVIALLLLPPGMFLAYSDNPSAHTASIVMLAPTLPLVVTSMAALLFADRKILQSVSKYNHVISSSSHSLLQLKVRTNGIIEASYDF